MSLFYGFFYELKEREKDLGSFFNIITTPDHHHKKFQHTKSQTKHLHQIIITNNASSYHKKFQSKNKIPNLKTQNSNSNSKNTNFKSQISKQPKPKFQITIIVNKIWVQNQNTTKQRQFHLSSFSLHHTCRNCNRSNYNYK
jgi:hypothetical protein